MVKIDKQSEDTILKNALLKVKNDLVLSDHGLTIRAIKEPDSRFRSIINKFSLTLTDNGLIINKKSYDEKTKNPNTGFLSIIKKYKLVDSVDGITFRNTVPRKITVNEIGQTLLLNENSDERLEYFEYNKEKETIDMPTLNSISLSSKLNSIDDPSNMDITEMNDLFNDLCGSNKDDIISCCDNQVIDSTSVDGIIKCRNCSVVLSDGIDDSSENKVYQGDQKDDSINRCGGQLDVMFPQSSTGTVITGKSSNNLQRVNRWFSSDYSEKSLNRNKTIITNTCKENGLKKNVIDLAVTYYYNIHNHKKIKRGENLKSFQAGCVFYACISLGCPKDEKAVAKMFGLKDEKIRSLEQISKMINVNTNNISFDNKLITDSQQYIIRYCDELNICPEYCQLACDIAHNSQKLMLTNTSTPRSIAGGSLLLLSEMMNLKIEQKLFSIIPSKTPVTVNKVYNKIRDHKYILADNNAVNTILLNSQDDDDYMTDSEGFVKKVSTKKPIKKKSVKKMN
jgi:transcription initiation factor TFIIIB Brf1 subunit/transcription initiation factor TFIIB